MTPGDALNVLWLVGALCFLAAVLLAVLPMECPEDCAVCAGRRKDRKDKRDEEQRKRNDDWLNGKRPRP